jgi:hypothetical protein
MRHYINLSNGVRCPHYSMIKYVLKEPIYWMRIQSTQCEQKLWPQILRTLGPQFYMDAASRPLLIHDQSERNRETRAMWQGLSWVRYALNRAWYGLDTQSFTRSGLDVTLQWREAYRSLTKSDRAQLNYYRQFTGTSINLTSCWKREDAVS